MALTRDELVFVIEQYEQWKPHPNGDDTWWLNVEPTDDIDQKPIGFW